MKKYSRVRPDRSGQAGACLLPATLRPVSNDHEKQQGRKQDAGFGQSPRRKGSL
jgi:hypothetical protein